MATSDQEEIARLRAINEELEYDLSEAQDQLLSLTEKDSDVPEKEVKDAYLAVIRGVNFWIDDVSGHKEFDFRPKWLQHLQSRNRKESLEDLGLDVRCRNMTWQKTLGETPSAHYTFLSLVIVNILNDNVFDRSSTTSRGAVYPFSLNENFIKLVEELQQVMGSEELGRDESQILRWRGETISAMNLQQQSRKQMQDEIDGILRLLTDDLDDWLDQRVLQDRKTSLQQYVIDPAIEFVRLAGCAHKKYILEVANFVPGPVPDTCFWNIRDVSNWRQITPSEARGVFHCLWPMLVRKGTGSQPDNQLVQPVMIGFRDPELDLPELLQSAISQELASPTRRRSDTTRSRKSTSPPKKSSSAKHSARPAEKESFLQKFHPRSFISSTSKSKDAHYQKRPSTESTQVNVGNSPTKERQAR